MNSPLTSNEQAKVLAFCLILIALIGAVGSGAFLILVTLWGVCMMKHTQDFSFIATITRIHKFCTALGTIGLLACSLYIFNFYSWEINDDALIFLFLSIITYPTYSYLVDVLFYTPLVNHAEWVVANGIFATTEAKSKEPRTTPLISLSSFSVKCSSNLSVADELIKLNDLKEKGLVTQDEVDKLRKALLS